MKSPHLMIAPSVPVWIDKDILIFDRKFYDGLIFIIEHWPGIISCIFSIADSGYPEFGTVKKHRNELSFHCITLKQKEIISIDHIREASVVLASGDTYNQFHLSKLCNKNNIKCLYVIEYIPETRYQIVKLNTNNLIVRLRRYFYIWQNEQQRIKAFFHSNGIQSNGTPAYQQYKQVKNNLLYFDTRVGIADSISESDLSSRLEYLLLDNPLRLAFSGRLIKMKGADHLIKLAAILKCHGINFSFAIYGTGELQQEMISLIDKHTLYNHVSMKGSLDFYQELLPDLKKNVDLFVCLHRQSDPSCTYLETLSCGIPIVGYRNKAFDGLLQLSDIGWGTKMDDINEIAKIIIYLDKNRIEISKKSKNSILFARPNNFEATFTKRINQLLALSDH